MAQKERSGYTQLSVKMEVFDKFQSSKAKYGKKVGFDGTVTEFMTLILDYWDSGQAIQEAVETSND